MTISGRRYPDGGDSVQLLFDERQRAVAVGHAVYIVRRFRRCRLCAGKKKLTENCDLQVKVNE